MAFKSIYNPCPSIKNTQSTCHGHFDSLLKPCHALVGLCNIANSDQPFWEPCWHNSSFSTYQPDSDAIDYMQAQRPIAPVHYSSPFHQFRTPNYMQAQRPSPSSPFHSTDYGHPLNYTQRHFCFKPTHQWNSLPPQNEITSKGTLLCNVFNYLCSLA